MFVVERQGSSPIVASSPEEAIRKYRALAAKVDADEENVYYNVWNTNDGEFFVFCHWADRSPIGGHAIEPEYEKIVHFDVKERKRLVDEMIFKAHCDDKVLRQLCEMAATCINTQDSYKDWVGEDSDEADA